MSEAKLKKNKIFKVVLLGGSGVGKSCLVLRYVTQNFVSNPNKTVSAGYFSKIVQTKTNNRIKLELWDTAGEEKYDSIAPIYYRLIIICIYLT